MDLKQYDKTPAEWLYFELFYFLNGQSEFEEAEDILKRAKEMEKEQIIDFALECQEMFKHQILEKFNETYGGNK